MPNGNGIRFDLITPGALSSMKPGAQRQVF
jgi:hypothetical protein